jgi:hypothetical protein
MTDEQTDLPDYLNGRNDSANVAARLKTDADFAADADLLQELRSAVRAQAEAIDAGAGLAALHERIARPSPWRHVRHFFEKISGPGLAPAIMAVLVVVCVVQGTMLWKDEPAELGMMADEATPGALGWRATPAAKASLHVRFDSRATLAQIEAALQRARARIVAGPLADGSYQLDAAVPGAAAVSLRASAVVLDVRTLPAPAPR